MVEEPMMVAIDGSLSDKEWNAVKAQWPKIYEELAEKSKPSIQKAALDLILRVHSGKN